MKEVNRLVLVTYSSLLFSFTCCLKLHEYQTFDKKYHYFHIISIETLKCHEHYKMLAFVRLACTPSLYIFGWQTSNYHLDIPSFDNGKYKSWKIDLRNSAE